MRRIIEPGSDTFKTECPRCSCVFKYEQEDILEDAHTKAEFVECPWCNAKIPHFTKRGGTL